MKKHENAMDSDKNGLDDFDRKQETEKDSETEKKNVFRCLFLLSEYSIGIACRLCRHRGGLKFRPAAFSDTFPLRWRSY